MRNIKTIAVLLFLAIAISSCSKDNQAEPKILSPSFEYAFNTVTAIPDGTSALPKFIETIITIDKDGIIADGSKIIIELDLVHSW